MHLPPAHGALLVAVVTVLAVVVLFDLRARKIPNACVVLLVAGGLVHAAFVGWSGVLASLVGMAVGGGLLLWPYSKGWMGAGDVKLLAGIGAWVGSGGALFVLLFGSALGGVLALVTLVRLGREERAHVRTNVVNAALLRGMEVPEPSALSKARGVPFGVPLSLMAAGLMIARSLP